MFKVRGQFTEFTGKAEANPDNGTLQSINASIDEGYEADIAAKVSNLLRCYDILRDPRLFRSASAVRYRTVLNAVEEALFKAGVQRPEY